jgi:hypothetical protein
MIRVKLMKRMKPFQHGAQLRVMRWGRKIGRRVPDAKIPRAESPAAR